MSAPTSFGIELRRRRDAAGLSLSELAKRVHYSKGHLSKVESGRKPASAELARLCDAELSADGKLIELLHAAPPGNDMDTRTDMDTQTDSDNLLDDETWVIGLGRDGGYFAPVSGSAPTVNDTAAALGMIFDGRLRADTDTALGLFLSRFDKARALGQVTGAGAVFPLVLMEAKTLQALAEHAPPDEKGVLLQLAARYTEFAGWMAQEAGDDRMSWWLTKKAVSLADSAGDRRLRAYSLIRRADITLHQDDALSTIELAIRAQQHAQVSVRISGLAAQREAQGHALTGDHTACLRAIERSAILLTEAATGVQDGPALGTVHTPDLVTLTEGWCLHELGRPARAAEILDLGIARFPPGALRARVRYEARAALAYATAGELERSCELVVSLLGPARILDSATIRYDLRRLYKVLVRWRSQPAVRTLLPTLITLLQIHPRLTAATPAANLLSTPNAE